tara:strand:+ start:553 stop:657 length:105 start_codon:yes stop_codon:yes gene_type:complete
MMKEKCSVKKIIDGKVGGNKKYKICQKKNQNQNE